MFVRRHEEYKLLEEQYTNPGNGLVILYGRKGVGKTTLLSEFIEDKTGFYYEGVECVEQMQISRMYRHMIGDTEVDIQSQTMQNLFSSMMSTSQSGQKRIIVLDEFHLIVKHCSQFQDIFQIFHHPGQSVLLILCSSSIRWIENDMIEWARDYASYITAYLKLKEFTFVDLVKRFPNTTVENCIYINAILGGVPDYLNEWQQEYSIKENMIATILNKDSRLFGETTQILKQELREPAVYNTILTTLAQGNRKLNEIHGVTGFSRAKISVYLKHLIQLDLVEKLVPLGVESKENAKKGLYRIKDNFFSFWYRYVFPNKSQLMLGNIEHVYDTAILPTLNHYIEEYFSDVCTEYLKLMNLQQRLPKKFLWWDRWYGKNGTIDIIAKGEHEETLVGMCLWEERPMETREYEQLILRSKEAGITPMYCYLFSKSGFSKELSHVMQDKLEIIKIKLEDL